MMNFYWWKLTAHRESGQSAHNTRLYLFGQGTGMLVYSMGLCAAEKQHCGWEGNAAIQTLSSIKPYHSSLKMCIPSFQTYWQKPQTTGILHILMLKWVLIKLGFTVDVIRCWSTVDVLYLQFFNNLLYICLIEEKRCVVLLWVLLKRLLNFTLSYKIFICISLSHHLWILTAVWFLGQLCFEMSEHSASTQFADAIHRIN